MGDAEEGETREGNEVDGQLSEVTVELPGKPEGASDATHHGGDEVVEACVGGGGLLERVEGYVVESLIVEAEHCIRVLDQLVER